jgi:hypothetical protein
MLRQSHSRDHLVDRGALRPCGEQFPALPQQFAQFLASKPQANLTISGSPLDRIGAAAIPARTARAQR